MAFSWTRLREHSILFTFNTSDDSIGPPEQNIPQTLGDAPFDDSYSEFFEKNPYLLRDAKLALITRVINVSKLLSLWPNIDF